MHVAEVTLALGDITDGDVTQQPRGGRGVG